MKEKSDVFGGLIADLVGRIAMVDAVGLLECGMIQRALDMSAGNQSAASRLLKIHRNTLQKKKEEYGIDGGRPKARRKPVSREARTARTSRRPKNGAA